MVVAHIIEKLSVAQTEYCIWMSTAYYNLKKDIEMCNDPAEQTLSVKN